MGNALSEEEQEQIMEEAYNLEDPGADRQLNAGTAAPNCQPKHTQRETEPKNGGSEGDETAISHKNQRTSSTTSVREAQEDRRKRQHMADQQQQEDEMTLQQKKLSYFQMARLGYQELVNAIIRPPRADYKVRPFPLSCIQ